MLAITHLPSCHPFRQFTWWFQGRQGTVNDTASVDDNMGRLIGTSTQYTFLPGHNFQNLYTYDAASNRVGLVAPDNSTNTYQYDTLNRLTTLTNSLTGSSDLATTR